MPENVLMGLFKYAFSLYTLLKDVCKVSGCDSKIKWSVGAITGVQSHG